MGTEQRRLPTLVICGLLSLWFGAHALRAYTAGSSKWTGPIVLQLALGPPSTPLIDGSPSWDAVAQSALAAWNPHMGSIQFTGDNASSAPKGQGNGINNVFFSSTAYGSAFGANTLAVTISYTSGNMKVEGDVLFNTAFRWDSYRGPLRFSGGQSVQDFYRVALHEFGHVLGLNHPDQAGQSVPAIMNSTITNLDSLTADDIDGARSIYAAGALTVPSITSHPSAQTTTVGGSAQFSVTAAGSPPLAYRWSRNGSPIADATQPTLSLTNVQLSAAGSYTVTVSNAAGSVTSTAVLLTVNPAIVAPQILTHPASQSVTTGSSVTFSTAVSGTPPFTYQWKRNNQVVASQATPDLTLTSVSLAHAGSYTVTVSNVAGSVTSNVAILTVIPGQFAPSISTHPFSRSVAVGTSVSFEVVASGNPDPSYQWRKNSVTIPGATAPSFAIAAVAPEDAGVYTVVVSNIAGSITSTPATLTIAEHPAIAAGPISLSVQSGQPASLMVTATGSPPLQYQWRKDGAVLTGAVTDTLRFAAVTPGDAGSYTVQVSNPIGSVVSAPAALIVTPAPFAPQIQSQPQSLTVPAGGTASFSASAVGLPAPTYQWSKNNIPLSGATSSTLLLAAVSPSDAGSYTVRATNSEGSAVSSAAILTVTTPPAIASPPASQTLTAGQAASFSVVATGTGPLAYQWKKDSVTIPGATGSTLAFSPVTLADAGVYTVTVQNSLGAVTSPPATLTVLPPDSPPSIQTPPSSRTAKVGDTVTFSITASGLPAPTYQWYNDDTPIPGATQTVLTLGNVTLARSGSYWITATNSLGTARSEPAYLVVLDSPRIIRSPAHQAAAAGARVSLEVIAAGADPLAYQWYFNGREIEGARQAVFVIASAEAGHAGDYSVRVTNAFGAVVSSAARLAVTSAQNPPRIVTQPQGQTVFPNTAATLKVVAEGTGPLSYQWYQDGRPIDGATASTLPFASVTFSHQGTYKVVVTSPAGSVSSDEALLRVVTAPPPPARLVNLSVRAQAGTGENALTMGFVTQGTTPKELLIRGAGPSLVEFGVHDALGDPQLNLFDEHGQLTAHNNDWESSPGIAATFAHLGAFAFPSGSKDAAISASLSPGAYSAQLTSADGGSGVALVELYDANSEDQNSRLINLSVRNFVGADERSLFVGIVIQGSLPKTLLIRGVGPTLRDFGLNDVLENPHLALLSGSTVMVQNDNWGGTESLKEKFAAVGAFALPGTSLDSALLVTLIPGTYTVQLSGVNATAGIALLEIYAVPEKSEE